MRLIDIAGNDATLRPYQVQSKINIYKAWESSPSVMFQMPTGTGKTRLFASIIRDTQTVAHSLQQRQGVLVLAHRTELIEQIDGTLSEKYHIAHGIIKSGVEEDMRFPVQVASVQSISRRLDKWKAKSFSYIIIDEAHHAMAKTYRKICQMFPYAKLLGVTATPYRLSGESFRDLFGNLIVSQGVSKFIEQGYLSRYQYYSIKPDSFMQNVIDNIDEFGADGDYKEEALMQACDKDYIRAGLVDAYRQYAYGKKGIIYTICKAHNEHVCKAFEEIGLRVVSIDSSTPAGERKRLVKEFRAGNVDIICNVNIFSEGFDCPDIEFIQLARPTMSLAMYLQQVGRGLRPCNGKNGAIIIDNVGLFNRFGLPSANRQWKRHFEGKHDIEETPTYKKKRKKNASRERDFSEGNEELELIYSFESNPVVIEKEDAASREELSEVIDSFEQFPVGVKGLGVLKEYEKTIADIKSSTDLSTDEKKERLAYSPGALEAFCFKVDGAIHYKNIDEWIEDVEQDFSNREVEQDIWDYLYDVFYYTVKFKFRGKYGIGIKKYRNQDAYKVLSRKHISLDDLIDIQLAPIFDDIRIPDSADNFVCVKDGKCGLIRGYDKTEALPFIYDDIKTLSDVMYLVTKGRYDGVISNGEYILKCEYDAIYSQPRIVFGYHYIIVEKDGCLGFCDLNENPMTIHWKVKTCEKLNDKYWAAAAPEKTLFITDEIGHIRFPFAVSAIRVTDDNNIPLIVDVGHPMYISDNCEIYIPKRPEENIHANSLQAKEHIIKIVKNNNSSISSIGKSKKTKAQTKKQITQQSPLELKEGINIKDNSSIYIIKNGSIASIKKYESISNCTGKNNYRIKDKGKFGVIHIEGTEIIEVISPIFQKIENIKKDYLLLYLQEGKTTNKYLFMTGDFSMKPELLLFRNEVFSHYVFITEKDNGAVSLIIDKTRHEKYSFSAISFLFENLFKFKSNRSELWGLFRITKGGKIEIVKREEYSEIKEYNKEKLQLIMSRPNQRGRIISIPLE